MTDGEGDGGEAAPEGAGSSAGGQGPVPYERFAAVAAERKALKAQLAELTPKVAGLDAATKEAAEARAALETARADFSDRLALHQHGITDDEGQDVARVLYGRIQGEGKPKTLSDWLGSLKAEGATVPKPLAPYLAPPATPAPAHAAAAQPKAAQRGATAPAATGSATEEAIRSARLRGSQTGDWADFKRLVGMS